MNNKLYKHLLHVKESYSKGENIINLLRDIEKTQYNTTEAIQISYDFQTGNYIQYANENHDKNLVYCSEIASILNKIGPFDSILEAGIGEATTLGNMLPLLNNKPSNIYGFDISWSRVSFAKMYLQNKGFGHADLFTGDLFNIPLADKSVDVVFTSHAIEPNGSREEEILKELFRVTKKYLVLFEPIYELATEAAQERMRHHGYVRNLKATAEKLGMKIEMYQLMECIMTPLNPSGIILISVENENNSAKIDSPVFCPITKTKLEKRADCYYSPEGLLAYPIVGGIPCLLPENAILATKFDVRPHIS